MSSAYEAMCCVQGMYQLLAIATILMVGTLSACSAQTTSSPRVSTPTSGSKGNFTRTANGTRTVSMTVTGRTKAIAQNSADGTAVNSTDMVETDGGRGFSVMSEVVADLKTHSPAPSLMSPPVRGLEGAMLATNASTVLQIIYGMNVGALAPWISKT